jgi:hypothetical protein
MAATMSSSQGHQRVSGLGAGAGLAVLVDGLGSEADGDRTGEPELLVLVGPLAEEDGALAEAVLVAVTVVVAVAVAVTVCTLGAVDVRSVEPLVAADSVAGTEAGRDGGTRLGATVGGRDVAVAALVDGEAVATGVGVRSGLGDRLTVGVETVGAMDLVGVGNPGPPPVEQPATITIAMISRALAAPARMIFLRLRMVLLGPGLGLDGMSRGRSLQRCVAAEPNPLPPVRSPPTAGDRPGRTGPAYRPLHTKRVKRRDTPR